jgi:hypothetical protein
VFGHLVSLLGAWLDELYDQAQSHSLNAQSALLGRWESLMKVAVS